MVRIKPKAHTDTQIRRVLLETEKVTLRRINSAIYKYFMYPTAFIKRAFRGILVPSFRSSLSPTRCTSLRSFVTARLSHPSNDAFAPLSHASDQDYFLGGRVVRQATAVIALPIFKTNLSRMWKFVFITKM